MDQEAWKLLAIYTSDRFRWDLSIDKHTLGQARWKVNHLQVKAPWAYLHLSWSLLGKRKSLVSLSAEGARTFLRSLHNPNVVPQVRSSLNNWCAGDPSCWAETHAADSNWKFAPTRRHSQQHCLQEWDSERVLRSFEHREELEEPHSASPRKDCYQRQ